MGGWKMNNKTLANTSLLELLPEPLRQDPDIIAASHAVDKEFQELVSAIKNCLTFAGVNTAREDVLDELAAELQVEFYSSDLPVKTKRNMIEGTYLYKYMKGTPFAVKQLVGDVFEEVLLEEWFEYGDEPGYFRLATFAGMPDPGQLARLFSAIDTVKRASAWLRESFFSFYESELPVYFGGAVHTGVYQVITQVEED